MQDNLLFELFKEEGLLKRQFRKWVRDPFEVAISGAEKLSREEEQVAATVYARLWLSNVQESTRGNMENNSLLATSSISAAKTGEIDFYRFVCMPYIGLVSDQGEFVSWKYVIGTYSYDTLTPAMSADKKLLSKFDGLVQPRMTFILDDWEVPFLRTNDLSDVQTSGFLGLNPAAQELALKELEKVRNDVTKWIAQKTADYQIVPEVKFFSEIVGYKNFVDLVSAFQLEAPTDEGIYKAEVDFVRKSIEREAVKPSELGISIRASRRIAQYAVEGAILKEQFKNGIFLCSEYPTVPVWQKLNMISSIPSLFYVKDSEVKNI